METILTRLAALTLLAAAAAFGIGFARGLYASDDRPQPTYKEKFLESVYRHNDRWCVTHPRYCKE